MSRPVILYVSYDGMLEPLGQSQVLAYLKELARGHDLHLISYEKATDWADAELVSHILRDTAAAGIAWHPLRYHKRPSAFATAWDILVGIVVGIWLTIRHRVSIVHARSYVAAVVGLVLKKVTGRRFVFDMRGFWADERVDGGLWPADGGMYRIAKWFERQFLRNADHVVSLTHAASREMLAFDYLRNAPPQFTVIPTCADLARFSVPQRFTPASGFVLGYVGSAGTWYLFDEVIACFCKLRELRPNARLRIVNRGEHTYIIERLQHARVPQDAFDLVRARHAEIPALMAGMSAGIFFYKPTFSRAATSPTKLAEFLGCGVPCLSNVGVGDMAELLEAKRVGVALPTFDSAAIEDALRRLILLTEDSETPGRCIDAAREHFSLERGVRLYESVYQRVRSAP